MSERTTEMRGLGFLSLLQEKYAVGDTAHIYIGNHGGKTSEGTVVAILDLPGWGTPNYVIEVPTCIDPLLEVRSAGLGMRRAPVGHEVEEDDDAAE